MRLSSMFSSQHSPIAIDFGASSLKMLQVSTEERPSVVAAAEVEVPDEVRLQPQQRLEFYAQQVPKLLKAGGFKGKRVVCAVPGAQTLIQHMQLSGVDDSNRTDAARMELSNQHGCNPDGVVVRALNVTEVHRQGQSRNEVICLAITRETVMRFVEMLNRCKLEAAGVHTQPLSMVRAFDHLNRRKSDEDVTTLYLDLSWSGTSAVITHGREIVFARYIPIGGRKFDEQLSDTLNCDAAGARAHRLSLLDDPNKTPVTSAEMSQSASAEGAGGSATAVATERRQGQVPPELQHSVEPTPAPSQTSQVDFGELLDTLVDELSMCLRYHNGLFPQRKVDRVILLGGESRQPWLCQRLVKGLRIAAQLGDPLARYTTGELPDTPGLLLGQPQPGWATACGLCAMPTDL